METTVNYELNLQIAKKLPAYPTVEFLDDWFERNFQQKHQTFMWSLYNFSGKLSKREMYEAYRKDCIANSNPVASKFVKAIKQANLEWHIEIDDIDYVTVGISYGKGTYHWFEVTLLSTGKGWVSHHHSYSQINGKTEKGMRWRWNQEKVLAKRLGLKDLHEAFKFEPVSTIEQILNDK